MSADHPTTPPFFHPVRVYWEDTDAGGVVFYANYLRFFERARTEWLRAAGVGQQALAQSAGLLFVVGQTQVKYLAPARLDDALQVSVEPLEVGRARLVIAQRCWCGPTLLCEGHITVACVDAGTFRPRRIPNDILERLLPRAGAPTA